MKNMNYKQKLTKDQFSVLSYLATCLYSGEKNTSYLRGLEAGCTFSGVPDEILFEVTINKNFTGLRNYNRLTYIELLP